MKNIESKQKVKSSGIFSNYVKNKEIEINEPVEPIVSDLILQEDIIKEVNENKTLSILKKVDGVLNYYQEIQKDKEKNAIPKYLYDLTLDILYLEKCQDFVNKWSVRLPILVIEQEYYEHFKEFLVEYYQYKKFKENKYLADYLILGSHEIKNYKPFHDSQEYGLIAECINTGLIMHYDYEKIYTINGKLKEYFKSKDIKGINIDLYYDEWITTVMNIFFNFALFNYNMSVKAVKCQKCKKFAYFISLFDFNDNYIFYDKVYKDMEYNETYEVSVDIANNMVNNLVNIIYYDEGINDHRNEIVGDSFVFEKECGGTLLLVNSIKSMLLVLLNLKRKKDNDPTFLLICTGSSFVSLMKYIGQYKDLDKYIKKVVIYTYNIDKYSYLKEQYKIIEEIYCETEDIIKYIRRNKSNKNIKYKVPNLITYKQYEEKYIEFHKIISKQYGKLYQKSSYLTAINILDDYLRSNNKVDSVDLQLLIKNLEIFSRGSRNYKEIIKEYTNDSFYALFNKWLNEIDPLAIKKIAFFISGLQLSLNIYGIKDQKGFNCKSQLYRGALFDYSLILNYERNVGNIITFPSFFSTTLDINIAKQFSQYNESKEERGGLFSTNYIINLLPNNDWIEQGFNVSGISFYKNESEILFQPFCFFRIHKVEVKLDKYICYIYLELIGKKEIWEKKMDDNSTIKYQEQGNFIELK